MFQNAICRHTAIQTVDYSPHTYLETHHWLKASVILDKPAKRKLGTETYHGYGSRKNARTYMIDCLCSNLPDFEIPATDEALIYSGWEALCERFAQPVFFEKSPQYLGFPASLDLIEEWLGKTKFKVKFIGLTRNPLSVQYSAWKLFHRDPKDRQFGWKELQEEMLDFETKMPVGSFLHVKYEDLIQSTIQSFHKIFNFIGVDPDVDLSSEIHRDSLNKWRDDPHFTLRLDDSVKQLALRFGYSEEELTNPEKPEPPILKKVFHQLIGKCKLAKAHLKDRYLKPIRLRLSNGRKT